jgi:hypothetical protein
LVECDEAVAQPSCALFKQQRNTFGDPIFDLDFAVLAIEAFVALRQPGRLDTKPLCAVSWGLHRDAA